MITLELAGFRSYDTLTTFQFTPGQVIRLSGTSGAGKTTLLDAIQWVLYNYPTTNIYPRNGSSKKTMVALTIPIDSIPTRFERRKNPGLLIITDSNGLYEEDDVAQGRITRLFGGRDVWRSCAYLPQDEYCPLLSLSNAHRIEIIEAVTFLDQAPDADLARIDDEVTRRQGDLDAAQAASRHLLIPTTTLVPPFEAYAMTDEEMTEGRLHGLALDQDITHRSQDIAVAVDRNMRHDALLKRRHDLESIVTSVFPDGTIDRLEERLTSLNAQVLTCRHTQSILDLQDRLRSCQSSIQTLEDRLSGVTIRNYTHAQITRARVAESTRATEVHVAQGYGIDYTTQAIQDEIGRLDVQILEQRDARTWASIHQLEARRDTFVDVEADPNSEVEACRHRLRCLNDAQDIHRCPTCSTSLRLVHGSLVPSEVSPSRPDRLAQAKAQLDQAQQAQQRYEKRRHLDTQIESLRSTLTSTQPPRPNRDDIATLTRRRHDLARLTVPHPPEIEARLMEDCLDLIRHQADLAVIRGGLSSLGQIETPLAPMSMSALTTEIKATQAQLTTARQTLARREAAIASMSSLDADLANMPRIDVLKLQADLATARLDRDQLQGRLDRADMARRVLDAMSAQKMLAQDVVTANRRLAGVLRLRDLAVQEVCGLLEEKITSINASLTSICHRLFREPITVEIAMTKTVKSTKTTRPCVHLRIWHKGIEHDSITTMCGGEKRRVSLAMSLALASASSFPLILLDECLNGLDDELKEIAVELLHELPGKTPIVIMHDGSTGVYDQVIRLD